jgi:hypothetical protein
MPIGELVEQRNGHVSVRVAAILTEFDNQSARCRIVASGSDIGGLWDRDEIH